MIWTRGYIYWITIYLYIYREAQTQFHLEAGYLLYFYYEGAKAEQHFEKAHELSNVNVELTGNFMFWIYKWII